MKKIILTLCLTISSLGIAQQVLITDFQTTPNFASWDGATVSNGDDPQIGGTRGKNMKIDVTAGSGQFWQGAKVTFTNDNLMNLSNDKTVKVDVYSLTPRTIMAKLESGSSAPNAADDENHGGTGWETLTFTFTTGADGTTTANGNYNVIAFFPNRNGTSGWINPWASSTIYFDNVNAIKYVALLDPAPTTSATNPTTADSNVVMSMFNDKPSFTNAYSPDGDFGTRTLVNLDAENDQTIKMNFAVAGWGQYDNTPPSVATANFLNFDYYVPTLAAGSNGHGFWIMLKSSDASGEKQYRIGNGNTLGSANQAMVFDTWTTVSIPTSHFTNLGFDPATLLAWKLGSDSDLNTKFVYFDNIYFTANALSNNNFTENSISMYPNPAINVLNIEALNEIENISVYNLLGQEVISKKTNNKVVNLDIASINSGIYIIKTTIDGVVSASRFVKE